MYRILGGDGREYGPVSAETLRQWIAEGRASARTPARREDGGWMPLGSLPEFAGAAPDAHFAAPASPSAGAREAALRLANPAGIALMLVGGLGLLWLMAQGVIWAVKGPESNPLLQRYIESAGAPEAARLGMLIGMGGTLALGAIISGLALFAGWKLRRLESRGLVLAAAILSLLPCCGASFPFCFLSFPVGVWVIIVISRASVKSHFT